MCRQIFRQFVPAVLLAIALASSAVADPCGMVPPIYTGGGQPIVRMGDQQTYVFYQDEIETFVIRPGFSGKVDEFGMLIPFPTPPAMRKVPNNIFDHITAAIDPPEVVVDLRWLGLQYGYWGNRLHLYSSLDRNIDSTNGVDSYYEMAYRLKKDEVQVINREALGMYEAAVLAAGSAAALNRWMEDHGYNYPAGMDEVCNEYIDEHWCFVAVKAKIGQKEGVDPQPAQREVDSKLPAGATFDGYVQAMGFRFHTKELVVPMRLSAFNGGDLRNIVYLLTDRPQKIRSIPEEYVVRQVSGEEIYKNLTEKLPVRVLEPMAIDWGVGMRRGGDVEAMKPWHEQKTIDEWVREQGNSRDPAPHNAVAKELFANDLFAVEQDKLALPHEEQEKALSNIGERLGLRGDAMDELNRSALAEMQQKATDGGLKKLKGMMLTVVDGDFPREVLARKNLKFAAYHMPARRNTRSAYDATLKQPRPQAEGVLYEVGKSDAADANWPGDAQAVAQQTGVRHRAQNAWTSTAFWTLALAGLSLGVVGLMLKGNRQRVTQ